MPPSSHQGAEEATAPREETASPPLPMGTQRERLYIQARILKNDSLVSHFLRIVLHYILCPNSQMLQESGLVFKDGYNCPEGPGEPAAPGACHTVSDAEPAFALLTTQKRNCSGRELQLPASLRGPNPALRSSQDPRGGDPARRASLTHQAQAPNRAATPTSASWL